MWSHNSSVNGEVYFGTFLAQDEILLFSDPSQNGEFDMNFLYDESLAIVLSTTPPDLESFLRRLLVRSGILS